jgi:hypothetical protein
MIASSHITIVSGRIAIVSGRITIALSHIAIVSGRIAIALSRIAIVSGHIAIVSKAGYFILDINRPELKFRANSLSPFQRT